MIDRNAGQNRSWLLLVDRTKETQYLGLLRWASTSSEPFRLPEWWVENTYLGQGSPRERSPKGSRFSESLFLDVPGTATEQFRACGFKINSSSLDKAPKMRDSIRLNSFECFLVTLPSFSSETWEILSWAISGSNVFCSLNFQVFLSELPLIFSYFSKLKWYCGRSFVSYEKWVIF